MGVFGEIAKGAIFGTAGYALGRQIKDSDVQDIVSSYLGAVSFESLLSDWAQMHPCESINEKVQNYAEKNYISLYESKYF